MYNDIRFIIILDKTHQIVRQILGTNAMHFLKNDLHDHH